MTACMTAVTGLTTTQDGRKSTVDLRRPARMKEFFDAVFGCRWMSLILTRRQSPYGEISSQARGVAPLHNDTSKFNSKQTYPGTGLRVSKGVVLLHENG